MGFFLINMDIRSKFSTPRLILQVLKLMITKIFNGHHIKNHKARTLDYKKIEPFDYNILLLITQSFAR